MEGVALLCATIETFTKGPQKPSMIVATHFHEICTHKLIPEDDNITYKVS